MAVGIAALPGTTIRVSTGGQVVGELHFSSDNRLVRGTKTLKKSLGKRVANLIIQTVMFRFTRSDQDFGSFVYQPKNREGQPVGEAKRYHFSTAASEEVTAAPKKQQPRRAAV